MIFQTVDSNFRWEINHRQIPKGWGVEREDTAGEETVFCKRSDRIWERKVDY